MGPRQLLSCSWWDQTPYWIPKQTRTECITVGSQQGPPRHHPETPGKHPGEQARPQPRVFVHAISCHLGHLDQDFRDTWLQWLDFYPYCKLSDIHYVLCLNSIFGFLHILLGVLFLPIITYFLFIYLFYFFFFWIHSGWTKLLLKWWPLTHSLGIPWLRIHPPLS